MHQKILTTIVIAMITALIGLVVRYVVLQKPLSNPISQESALEQRQPDWKTYHNTQYRFAFQYPSGLDFQPVAHTDAIEASVESGLPSDPRIDSVRVSIDIDPTISTQEGCTPTVYPRPSYTKNIAQPVQIGSNLFSKYLSPNLSGCGGTQCDAGNLYALWHNNSCYQFVSSYRMDYLEKIFSCSSPEPDGISKKCGSSSDYPKYLAAKKSQQHATAYLDTLTQNILSTFSFAK